MKWTTKRNSKKWISSMWTLRHRDRLKFNWRTSRICLLKLLERKLNVYASRESQWMGRVCYHQFIIKFRVPLLRRSPTAAGVNKLSNIIANSAHSSACDRNCYKAREKPLRARKIPRETGFETLSSHRMLPPPESLDGKTYLMKSCFPNAFVIRLSGEKNSPATLSQQ